MRFIADFHLHSRYSRATSSDMVVETIDRWARLKGIKVLSTGDFTHPGYFAELKSKLQSSGNGLFSLKGDDGYASFILTTEVSNIFHQSGKLRKIHTLIFAPSFELVEALNRQLDELGKLEVDGRPTFSFPVRELVRMIADISDQFLIVPAHAWTPWFSLFGANSGFDSMEECFGDELKHIYAIETGLSSDPQMNWRLSALDGVCLISNSDAHSPSKIGREANVFDISLDYFEIINAIKEQDRDKFLYTIEFFPQEGKYHYDGHRNCDVLCSPAESLRQQNRCPVCGRRLTVGVMHRVETLADRPEGYRPPHAIPARHMVPLAEIIAESLNQGVNTRAVDAEYHRLVEHFGSEFRILLDLPQEELVTFAPPKIVEGIMRMRQGKLNIRPGYDGVFGKISILSAKEETPPAEQMDLF